MNTLRMIRQVIVHPYDFYHDIQQPGRIGWHQGVALIALVYLARMLSYVLTGYAFQTREGYQISSLHEFIWLVVPWLTWTISNWGVSAIMDGEGKFKEIFVGSAFAFVPYLLFILPITLLTNLLSLDESGIHSFLLWATYGWVVWLLLVKVKIVHDFELGKLIWIVLFSLIGIAILWFVGILMFGLINQFINFFIDIVKELQLRV